jgi:hypothetical protein
MMRWMGVFAVALAMGCEAVPTLTFVDDGGDDAQDAAQEDAAATDAASDAGCPQSPPSGASVCCGAVGCEGLCSTQCGLCASKCTMPGQYCCAKTNSVMCIDIGTKCH